MTPLTFPTLSFIERIASQSDPVLRNLQITQCYHELALVLAERTSWRANWCNFATWASKQAGQTIRKEDLIRSLEAATGSESAALQIIEEVQTAVQQLGIPLELEKAFEILWKAYDAPAAFERSSAAVARGNLKVFAEIGYEFARFYAECLSDPAYNPENIAHFIEGLRFGEPPEGQRYLRQAFQHYYQALFEENDKARTELLLLANLEIGFHEQTRLQPEINDALTAPVLSPRVFARNLLKLLYPKGGWITELGWFLLHLIGRFTELDTAINAYETWLKNEAQLLITETLMTIELPPSTRLRLGDDLTASFPPELEHISNPDLLALLAQIDPTPDSTRQSGTDYWGDLADRIHFIADMFRCYQISPNLLLPPFSEDQVIALNEDRLPSGRL